VFQSSTLQDLREKLLATAPLESAAILLAGHSIRPNSKRLLIRDIEIVDSESCLAQNEGGVTVSPSFLAPRIKRARLEGWSFILAHSHPFSRAPKFSAVDDECERILMPTVFGRAAGRPHGSLVLGVKGFDARINTEINHSEIVDELRQVGNTLRIERRESPQHIEEKRFDRNVRAFGVDGQRILASMQVGIVGLGGVGSLVAQQLAYLGVGSLVLLDPDKIDVTNLNRVVGATSKDVGRAKVDVASDHVKRISSQTRVMQIKGSAIVAAEGSSLLDTDVIFCCTDSHGSRAVLNQIAYQYFIPVFDLGTRIDARDGVVTDITGRAQMLAPGLACLVCQNLLDPEEVRRDSLSEQERQRDPYIVGSPEPAPAPAVISINGTIASLGVTMFLSAVTGIGGQARHQIYLGDRGIVRSIESRQTEGCIVCSRRGALGRGDIWKLPWRTA